MKGAEKSIARASSPCSESRFLLILLGVSVLTVQCFAQKPSTSKMQNSNRGVLLENLSWDEAEQILTPDRVVVIALGAESKEHGRHLQLNNDWVMAEYLKKRVLAAAPVVIAPTINYSFYPAFLEYPGSISLESNTARNMVVEICHTLALHGPRRFYILNTGISTIKPLSEAAKTLSSEGITMTYFDLAEVDDVVKKVQQEPEGTHADEIETSMMLYIAPDTVRMSKAEKDLHPHHPGALTRDPNATDKTYSPTGAWGDPTLATREKGKIVTEATVKAILGDIQNLQQLPVNHAACCSSEQPQMPSSSQQIAADEAAH
jgi:creatinine amidohydrolase